MCEQPGLFGRGIGHYIQDHHVRSFRFFETNECADPTVAGVIRDIIFDPLGTRPKDEFVFRQFGFKLIL